jgi:hypothetical protein
MTIKQTGGIFGRHPSFGDIETGGLDLSAISGTIGDTAVDVFVYDTSKDSDGGAWRKRTQGTSWYNETLNTATRGSRKEFPAVAVIVAESNTVTIYDGDDPDLPMWFVYDNISKMAAGSSSTGITAFNGSIVISRRNPTLEYRGGIIEMSFAADFMRWIRGNAISGWYISSPLTQRMDNFVGDGSGVTLVSGKTNDVAMTVLPNAPIDAATGLPVPTIAVATDGGVSVIKDDGTVVDTTSTDVFNNVSFTKSQYGADLYAVNITFADDPQWFPNVGGLSDGFTFTKNFYARTPSYEKLSSDVLSRQSGNVFAPIAEHTFAVGMGTSPGINLDPALNLVQHSATLDDSGLVAFINDDHNTGWMNGDIKLATLSDTDDTDVTGSELVTNGTFDSDSDWTKQTGWAIASGVATFSGTAYNYITQNISTVSGKTYTATFEITAITAGAALLRIMNGSTELETTTQTTVGTYAVTFVATSTTTTVRVYAGFSGARFAGSVDNVSVRLAEEDRSVNNNGLQVFGTVTKNPVATGADLVAYSGFSSSNYLEQPYNSDLDFGTGDFCVMGWVKASDTSVDYIVSSYPNDGTSDGFFLAKLTDNTLTFNTRETGVSSATTTTSTLSDGVWTHVCAVRSNSGATQAIYVDGVLSVSNSVTARNITNSGNLLVGVRGDGLTSQWRGSLALLRISATAPSAEQIAKIYEDEKFLFQENAQATLYGSSDAVTALAYDDSTELLHVGTSAGRSVFQGLRRVENTTDAVGAAISANNGLVADE